MLESDADMVLNGQDNSAQDRTRALDAAIEGLYSAFACQKQHGPVEGCPHCTSVADDQRLRGKPLRQLNGDDLERFAFKAVSTLGTVDDLKHFLPRLLEIAGRDGGVGGTEFEIVLGKLNYAGWAHWPRAQRAAIEQCLIALWQHLLGAFPASLGADTCLCGIAQAVDDLSPFLDVWRRETSLPAMQHLADFIDSNVPMVPKRRRLRNAFWGERGQQMQQVLDWLVQPATSLQLEEAFFRFAAEPAAAELSRALDLQEAMRSNITPETGST
jgi:hypothetical protein